MEAAGSDSGHSAEAGENAKMTDKDDIIRGFMKEKEIIEMAHKEEVEGLKAKFEEEKLMLKQELESEKGKLATEFQTKHEEEKSKLQYEAAKTREAIGKELHSKETRLVQQHKEEIRKLKREYEKIVQDKRNEIRSLSKDVEMYQQKELQHESAVNTSLELDVLEEKHRKELELMTTNHEQEVECLKEDFQYKLAEHERELQREGANFVQTLGKDAEKLYMEFEAEKVKIQQDHEEELKIKLETVERLLCEQAEADRNRMIKRFDDEMTQVEEELKRETTEKLFEKQRTILCLEKEKEDLIHTLHLERFSLARVYNREMSLLTKPDPISKEDLEVALIDEVAKVRHEYDVQIQNMEARQRQEVEEIRKSQRPLKEIEEKHKENLRELARRYEREKDNLEATLRREQFNLLKSFEFEKHDLERMHGEMLESKEAEFSKKCSSYENEIGELRAFAQERHTLREELEKANEKNADLQDVIEELKSKKAMLEDELEKLNRKCQQLQIESQQAKSKELTDKAATSEDEFKEISKLGKELDLEKERSTELESEIEELKSKLEFAEDTMERERRESQRLQMVVAELEQKLTENHVSGGLPSNEVPRQTRPANDQDALGAALELDEYGFDENTKRTLLDRFKDYLEKSEIEETEKDSLNKLTKPTEGTSEAFKASDADLEEKLEDGVESHPAGADYEKTALEEFQEISREQQETIKDLVTALETKDNEMKILQENLEKEKQELLQKVSNLHAELRVAVMEQPDDIDEVGDLRASNKNIKDAVNTHIRQVEGLYASADTKSAASEDFNACEGNVPDSSTSKLNRFLDDTLIVGKLLDKETKDKVNEYAKETMLRLRRKHELKQLKIKKRHLKDKRDWLQELTQDKKADLRLSEEALTYLQEKFELTGNETSTEMFHGNDSETTDPAQHATETEFNAPGRHTGDGSALEKLKKENEDLRNSLSELENNFKKEKEDLMETMCSQHKEFVMSPEAEVIEALIKERSALEHICNVERFYLSRLYYQEMKDELEERLAERENKVKESRINIALKFEKEISDLQKIIVQKDEREARLLEDKEDLMKQLLESQRSSPLGGDLDKDEEERLKFETARLQAMIPLKEEIVALQGKRHTDHESLLILLKEACSLIRDLMEHNRYGDNFQDNLSFQSDECRSGSKSPQQVSTLDADAVEQGEETSRLADIGGEDVAQEICEDNPDSTGVEFPSQDTDRDDRTSPRQLECRKDSVPEDEAVEEHECRQQVEAAEESAMAEQNREPQPVVSRKKSIDNAGEDQKSPMVDSGEEWPDRDTVGQSPPLDEIRSQAELRRALEDLIERVIRDNSDDALLASEFTSGASSDAESDTSQPPTGDEMEDLTDSGAELIEGETLTIKKANLDMALNLERFNLGRVYYDEFRDSLNRAAAKLAKAKSSLQNKGKNLQQVLLNEVDPLVDKTRFGMASIAVGTRDEGTQTPCEEKKASLTEKEERRDATIEKEAQVKESETQEKRKSITDAADTQVGDNNKLEETKVNTAEDSKDEKEVMNLQREDADTNKPGNSKVSEADLSDETGGSAGTQEHKNIMKSEDAKEIKTEKSEEKQNGAGERETGMEPNEEDEGSGKDAKSQVSREDEFKENDVCKQEDVEEEVAGTSLEKDGEDSTEVEGARKREKDELEQNEMSKALEETVEDSERDENEKYGSSDAVINVRRAEDATKDKQIGEVKRKSVEKKNIETQTDAVEIRSDIAIEKELGGKAKKTTEGTKTTGTQTVENEEPGKEVGNATDSADKTSINAEGDSNAPTEREGIASAQNEKADETLEISNESKMSEGEENDYGNSKVTQGVEQTGKKDDNTDGDQFRETDGEKENENSAGNTNLESQELSETISEEDDNEGISKDRSEETKTDEGELDGAGCVENREKDNLAPEREECRSPVSPGDERESEQTQKASDDTQECLEELDEKNVEDETGNCAEETSDGECSMDEASMAATNKDDKITDDEDRVDGNSSFDKDRIEETEDQQVKNENEKSESVSRDASEEEKPEREEGADEEVKDRTADRAEETSDDEALAEGTKGLTLEEKDTNAFRDEETRGDFRDSREDEQSEEVADSRNTQQETREPKCDTIPSEYVEETENKTAEPAKEEIQKQERQIQDLEDGGAVSANGDETQKTKVRKTCDAEVDELARELEASEKAEQACEEKEEKEGMDQSHEDRGESDIHSLDELLSTAESEAEQAKEDTKDENSECPEDLIREKDNVRTTAGDNEPDNQGKNVKENEGKDGVDESHKQEDELAIPSSNELSSTSESGEEQAKDVTAGEHSEYPKGLIMEQDNVRPTTCDLGPDHQGKNENEKDKSVLPSSTDDKTQKPGHQGISSGKHKRHLKSDDEGTKEDKTKDKMGRTDEHVLEKQDKEDGDGRSIITEENRPSTLERQLSEQNSQESEADVFPEETEDLMKKLRVENNRLKDKFNILRNLVGKGFVREIPELCEDERLSRILDGLRTLDEDELSHLYDEKERVTEELFETVKEIESLRNSDQNDAKDSDDELNSRELEVLKELEVVERVLKRNEERELIQHLFQEREKVTDRLEEIRKEMAQLQKQSQDNIEGSFVDLMTKEDLIKEEIHEQQAQLRHATRQQDEHQQAMAAKRAALEESIEDHTFQGKVLDESLSHKPGTKRHAGSIIKDVSRQGKLPDEIVRLIKDKVETSRKATKLSKELQKANSDKRRYERMLEDQQKRLKPFERKQERLEEALKSLQGSGDTKDDEEQQSLEVLEQQYSAREQLLSEAEKTQLELELQKLNSALQKEVKKVRFYNPRRAVSVKKVTDTVLKKRPDLTQENENVNESLALEKKKLNETDIEDADGLIGLLYEKNKIQRELLDVKSTLNSLQERESEEARDPTEDHKQRALIRSYENLRAALMDTEEDIQEEQVNISEALRFKRDGHAPQQETPSTKLVKEKERLLDELKQHNQIMLSAVEQAPSSFDPLDVEQAAERMVKLQAEIEDAQERIDAETTRAMQALSRLLEAKFTITVELETVEAELTNECAENSSSRGHDVRGALTLSSVVSATDAELEETSRQRNLLEEEMKQVLSLLIEAENTGKDPEEYEEKLAELISEKVILDANINSNAQTKDSAKFSEETDEGLRRKGTKLSQKLTVVESEVASRLETGEHQCSMNTLEKLLRAKVNIEADLKAMEKIADLLKQKQCVVDRLGGENARLMDEHFSLMRTMKKKENEIEAARRKLKEKEDLAETLEPQREAVRKHLENLDNEIVEAKKRVDEALEGFVKENEALNNEQQEMQDTVKIHQNELERSSKELAVVEEQLEARKKQIHQGKADPSELERLFVEKNIVSEYLDELESKLTEHGLDIDRPNIVQLDNYGDLTPNEIEELENQRRGIEERLKEIQDKRAKQELNLNDEDMEETVNILMANRKELEKKRNDLSERILGSGPFAKLAGGREVGVPDNGDDNISSYHEILDKVIAEDLTLVSQIQKAKTVKEVAQRQRDVMEEKLDAVTSKVGRNLVMYLIPDTKLASELPAVQQSILDRVFEDDMSINDVLNDAMRENQELHDLNDNLEKEIEDIRQKLGEEFASELSHSSIGDGDRKYNYIAEEIEREKMTVGELLRAQDENMEIFEANIGGDLTSALLAMNTDEENQEQTSCPLRAIALMKENNDDLQKVIEVYEMQLDALNHEIDFIKRKPGEPLADALMSSEPGKTSDKKETTARKEEAHSRGTERDHRNQTVDSGGRKPENEQPDNIRESTLENLKQNLQHLEKEAESAAEVLLVKDRYDGHREGESDDLERECSQPNASITELKAPKNVSEQHDTLADVIAEYERELDILKTNIGPHLSEFLLAKEDSKLDGSVDKNYETEKELEVRPEKAHQTAQKASECGEDEEADAYKKQLETLLHERGTIQELIEAQEEELKELRAFRTKVKEGLLPGMLEFAEEPHEGKLELDNHTPGTSDFDKSADEFDDGEVEASEAENSKEELADGKSGTGDDEKLKEELEPPNSGTDEYKKYKEEFEPLADALMSSEQGKTSEKKETTVSKEEAHSKGTEKDHGNKTVDSGGRKPENEQPDNIRDSTLENLKHVEKEAESAAEVLLVKDRYDGHKEGESDDLERECSQPNTSVTEPKAPKIVSEQHDTLAGVIADYERELDILKTNIGPHLSEFLLAKEDSKLDGAVDKNYETEKQVEVRPEKAHQTAQKASECGEDEEAAVYRKQLETLLHERGTIQELIEAQEEELKELRAFRTKAKEGLPPGKLEFAEEPHEGKLELDDHTPGTSDFDKSADEFDDGEVEASEAENSKEELADRKSGTGDDEKLKDEIEPQNSGIDEYKKYKEEFEKLQLKLGSGLTEALLLMEEDSGTEGKQANDETKVSPEALPEAKTAEKKKRKRSFFSLPFRKKSSKVSQSKCSLRAITIMQKDKKQLENVIESYEKELERLKKSSNDDGASETPSEIVSDYENKIAMLKDVNRRLNEDLERNSDLEKELKKLEQETGGMFAILGDDLSKDVKQLNEINRQRKDHKEDPTKGERVEEEAFTFKATLEILQEGTTVGDIMEKYEENLRNLARENEVLRRVAEEGDDKASFVDTISGYENKMKELERAQKNLERKYGLLSERVGKDLARDLVESKRENISEEKQHLKAVGIMSNEDKTLAQVVGSYEDELGKIKNELVALQSLLSDEESGSGKTSTEPQAQCKDQLQKLKEEFTQLEGNLDTITDRLGQEVSEEDTAGQDTLDREACESREAETGKTEMPFTEIITDQRKELERLKRDNDILRQLLQAGENQGLLSDEENGSGRTSTEPQAQCKDQRQKLTEEFTQLEGNLDTITDRLGQEVSEEDTASQGTLDREASDNMEVEIGHTEMPFTEIITDQRKELERLKRDNDTLRQLLQAGENPEHSLADMVSDYEDEIRTLRDENAALKKLFSDEDKKESVCKAFISQTDASVQVPEQSSRPESKEECLIEVHERTDETRALEDLMALTVNISREPVICMIPDNEVTLLPDQRQQITEEAIQPSREPDSGYSALPNLFGSLEDLSVSTSVSNEGLSNDIPCQQTDEEESDVPDGKELQRKILDLEEKLQNETDLRQRYEQDVNDLLQDIMNLKMAQAMEDDGEEGEEKRKEIKNQFDAECENRRLKNELQNEKKRRTSVEESKRELLYELEDVMRRKEELEKNQMKKQESERIGEELIKLRKTLAELQTKNDTLTKEVEGLKEKLKESEEAFLTEKEHLREINEQEKAAVTKELLNAKAEVELKLHEQLRLNSDLEIQVKNLERELAELKASMVEGSEQPVADDLAMNDEHDDEVNKHSYERMKNEALKEQLDDTEQALKETIERYREEIRTMETERTKTEEELRHENELLRNKLELEKSFAEQQKNDFDEILKRERARLKEEFESEMEREKTRAQRDLEELVEDHKTKEDRLKKELEDLERQFQDEKKDMASLFSEEKRKLQETFEEEFREKIASEKKRLDSNIREMESEFKKQKDDMRNNFEQEKSDLRAEVEKQVYEKLIKRNEEMEKEFQEMLSKVMTEHADEIKVVENEIKTSEERHFQETKKLFEETEKEKKRLNAAHQKEKNAYEITVQNLLKEVVKLKQQRKEMRMNYKVEQEKTEEAFEREKSEQQENWDKNKKELVKKLQEEHSKILADERSKFETTISELRQELKSSEESRKVLEESLREETRKFEFLQSKEGEHEKRARADDAGHIDVKVFRKTLEEEYEKRIRDEKRKHEESLQGLRREVASLQEKRKLIQEKVYNQEASTERHIIEKSIANYKKEVLLKFEEEFSQKLQREKRPLEEANSELRRENDELEQQRRELRSQLRKEQARFKDELERERERLEDQFVKEKEQMRARLESKLLQEYSKKTSANKVSRALSPIALDTSPRGLDDSARNVRLENMRLKSEKEELQVELERLTMRLEEQHQLTPRQHAEDDRAKTAKKVTFSEEVQSRSIVHPMMVDQQERMLRALREKDAQIRRLMEGKRFYEEVFGDLCQEAGLFELDRDEVI